MVVGGSRNALTRATSGSPPPRPRLVVVPRLEQETDPEDLWGLPFFKGSALSVHLQLSPTPPACPGHQVELPLSEPDFVAKGDTGPNWN